MPRRSQPAASRRLKNTDILAGTKLAMKDIRKLIECFANRVPARETVTQTGISHVTVYRFNNHLRKRLVEAKVFTDPATFLKKQREIEEETESWFDYAGFYRLVEKVAAAHRGVEPHNRELYVSEAIFFEYEHDFRSDDLVRLIMIAIRYMGPINRPPRRAEHAHFYLAMAKVRLAAFRRLIINEKGDAAAWWKIGYAAQKAVMKDVFEFLKEQDRLHNNEKPTRKKKPD
ncbi:hypothetical protein [Sinorhizobium medicae]